MEKKKKNNFRSNLKNKYMNEVITAMVERFKYQNIMEVPSLSHISVNMGIGDAKDNPKKLESAIQELTLSLIHI